VEPEFDREFETLRRRAYGVAFRLLGDRMAAEDVAAEALARAYSRWSSIADRAGPWVVVVAANLARDVGRKRARAARHVDLVESPVPDPQLERRLDLQRALSDLPRRQREVVILRYLDDLSEQATADALGIDVGTVKSHASRGLARLRLTVERV